LKNFGNYISYECVERIKPYLNYECMFGGLVGSN